MTEVLFEQVSPHDNIQAVVESDGKVCFFYLWGAPEIDFGVRAVWVRNLVDAPESLDTSRLERGEPPLNPASFCRDPRGSEPPPPDRLGVVWLPEGNGAALLENDEVLAIIPPWSGVDGFDGYARDCVGEGPLAWELRPDNEMLWRIDAARDYWDSWDDDALWPSARDSLLAGIEAALGPHSKYFAIDGGDWPPKALVLVPRPRSVALVTVGVCLRPQPNVEMYTGDPKPLRRIELGAVLPTTWSEDEIKALASYISAQSSLPWTNYTWLGPGHTIPCDAWKNDAYDFALLTSEHTEAPALALGTQFGDPVHVLWIQPITANERKRAMETTGLELANELPEARWLDA